MRRIVIIGNGISGITCARNVRKKCNDSIIIISSESEHFYSRTALMYIYMGHMKYEHTKPYEDFFWKKNNLDLVFGRVEKIDTNNKTLHLTNEEIAYDTLVIATGSVTQTYNWPGQQFKGVTGLYNLQDLEKMEQQTKGIKNAVVVGGGLIGVEMAEMLHTRKIHVTILVKDSVYWGSALPENDAKFIGEHIESNGISILYNIELKEIFADENGKVESIMLKNGEKINCQFVGISTGVKPNISFLKDSEIKTDKGILINEFFETSCKNVYAIGDCAQFEKPIASRKPLEQVWYTGRMHGETLAQTLCGNKTAYQPGPWYNSAKFFNVEYQTYGIVSAKTEKENDYFFWQHPVKNIAVGFYFSKENKTLLGINAYGMRLRHVVFDDWLRNKKSVEYILENFAKALFDAEFKKNYLPEIISSFNAKTGASVKRKKRFSFTN